MNRRQFAKKTILASAMVSVSSVFRASDIYSFTNRSLKKGIMWGSIGMGGTVLEKFQFAKQAGFEGIEPMSHLDRNEIQQG
jgi:L-ribulose-5-phosphate 3-epimerase